MTTSRIPVQAAAAATFALLLSLGLANPAAAIVLRVDFGDGGAGDTQAGFTSQGAVDATYNFGGGQSIFVDVPASGSITDRGSLGSLASSGSSFIPDGTDIQDITRDFYFRGLANSFIDITLSGVPAGRVTWEGWFSDRLQTSGLVFQSVRYSTDGGGSFSAGVTADPGGLDPSPTAITFLHDGLNDIVIRVIEINAANQLRLNAFAVSNEVPEPSTATLLVLGIAGLSAMRRKRRRVCGSESSKKADV